LYLYDPYAQQAASISGSHFVNFRNEDRERKLGANFMNDNVRDDDDRKLWRDGIKSYAQLPF
jgi:hypothetical protein